jgi:hypothetical protein
MPASAQDTFIYMTLHNLGCRQANDTYSGYIPNYGFAEGDLVQVILAGPNGHIDPPDPTGLPGGDDQLAVNPGLPFAMNPASFTHSANTFYSPEAILIESFGNGSEPALHTGSRFYVRVWNGPSPDASSMYYNSAQLTQDFPVGTESCPMDSAVRTLRNTPILPVLISYAVTLDGGHPFDGGPPAPQLLAVYDPAQPRIQWRPVPTATSYRVESSIDFANWNLEVITPDTTFLTTVPVLPGHRFYRVFAIQ